MANTYTLSELAVRLDARLHGDGACVITGMASLGDARAGQISFLSGSEHQAELAHTQASAVVLKEEHLKDCPGAALISTDPHLAYAKLAQLFVRSSKPKPGIHATAVLAASVTLAEGVSIGAMCVVGERVTMGKGSVIEAGVVIADDVRIGEDCHLYPQVNLGERVQLGSRVILHSGVVIGADGFGMARTPENTWLKIPQLGSVVIGDDVEIGANTCVDRGALGNTVIEEGVKLDNLIQVAHNVCIGAHTVIAGCVAIAGSVKIGRHCMIGGASTINGHIELCDGTLITGTSTVLKSTTEPGAYTAGFPALPTRTWKKLLIRFLQLDDIMNRLKALEKSE